MTKDFREEDKIKILLWCDRHCYLCDKSCGTNIIIHHIEQEEENLSDIDNAIPLCPECHNKIGSYNIKHPLGTKYKGKEIKARREQIYEKYTQHLVPPIHFDIHPRQGEKRKTGLLRVDFTISHLGDSVPVKAKVSARVFLGGKDPGLIENPKKPYYSGGILWNLNPRHTFFGNFSVPKKCVDSGEDLKMEVNVTIIDPYDRSHELLPVCYTYVRDKKYWFTESTSFNELKRFMT